jgi:hypothetical protein
MACTTTSVTGPTGPTLPAAIIAQDGERAPDPAGAADVAIGGMTITGPYEADAVFPSQCLDRSGDAVSFTRGPIRPGAQISRPTC